MKKIAVREDSLLKKMVQDIAQEIYVVVEHQGSEHLQESENLLIYFRTPSLETTTTREVLSPYDSSKTKTVQSERKKPISILNDLYCEEMAHLYLFPTRKYRYKIKRDISLSPRKYSN